MSWAVALKLGRVSNLPTVWSNVLAGAALAGATGANVGALATAMLALSLFYVGGMWLNDAFDAEIDAAERPDRPIPAGAVSRTQVFQGGFAMLASGTVLLATVALATTGAWAGATLAGAGLAGAIVFYDWHHKKNPLGPLVMGVCRMLVYVAAALALAGALPGAVLAGAAVLLCYLIGLTYTAKQEHLNAIGHWWPLAFLAVPLAYGLATVDGGGWLVLAGLAGWLAYCLSFVVRRAPGDIPRAVVRMIAGISLVDALLIAGTGSWVLVAVALACFAATLAAQRWVPGT